MQSDEKTTTTSAADSRSPAARAVRDVLVGLNHEIRTSMNGIVGMLDMLLDAGLPASHRDLAATAQHSAESLLGFIEAAVDLVALSEDCLYLEPRFVELSSVLQEAIDGAGIPGLQPMLPAAMLHGDPGRIRQVVAGLLGVAKSIGVAIEFAASAERRGAQCAVAVEITAGKCSGDTAAIAALVHAAPAGVEVVRTHGRPGLDIEVCKRLACLMDGRISIRRLQEASYALRFELALPLAAPSLQEGRLLIIEKQGEELKLLEALFARHGMEVDAFASAAAAIEALRKGSYRAAIIGRDEHGLDAELLGAALKADTQSRTLPLAALCEGNRDALSPELAQAGFGARIARPVDEAAALAAIVSLCGEREKPDTATPASPGSRHDFSGRRILVADDNSVNLEVARRMLEKLGCRVDVAMNGGEAIAKHVSQPYELILMDCQMPRVDGCEAVARIRALGGAASKVPVVAVTACTTQAERECCLSAGMDDFIAKPLRPQALDAALTKWLERQATAPSVPAQQCRDELDAVKEMFGKDFAELAKLYQADSPPRIAALHAAGAAGDAATVARIAHAFSGSSASMGASGMAALCKGLELYAKTGALDEVGQRMAAIEAEYARICGRLHALVNQ